MLYDVVITIAALCCAVLLSVADPPAGEEVSCRAVNPLRQGGRGVSCRVEACLIAGWCAVLRLSISVVVVVRLSAVRAAVRCCVDR